MIKAIVFDFDGTITDSVDIKTKAFAELYRPYGESVEKKVVEYHLAHGGVSRFDKFRYFHKKFLGINLEENEVLKLSQKFSHLVIEKVIIAPYIEGAFEFISNNYKRYDFFISTATPTDEIKKILNHKDLISYFKDVKGSPENKIDHVNQIISNNHFSLDEIIFLGDSDSDKEAADKNNIQFVAVNDDKKLEFDGIWESSLTDSTSKGKPDTELVDFTSRFQSIEEILEVTTKPIIVDGDTGGKIEHFKFRVKTLERLGVSAIIIEDKIGSKRNSLFGTDVEQNQDSIENFSNKISEGKKSLITEDFMIIARIESLILKSGIKDALKRARAYINAGADGIMIHSKEKDGKEIIDFCNKYKKLKHKVPLVVVPSTFAHITEDALCQLGVNVVIYANHLIRSAYPAMVKTAENILENKRSKEASDNFCMPIKEILTLIPEDY